MGKLTIASIKIVDISISKRTTSNSITANTNAMRTDIYHMSSTAREKHAPGNRPNHVENLEKHRLGDGGVKFSNIKGCGGSRSD